MKEHAHNVNLVSLSQVIFVQSACQIAVNVLLRIFSLVMIVDMASMLMISSNVKSAHKTVSTVHQINAINAQMSTK